MKEKSLRILFVDNNSTHHCLVEQKLRKHFKNLELKKARSARQCLNALSSEKPHALLLSHTLPKTDGIELLKKITVNGFDLPIILIIPQQDTKIARRAIKLGAYDCVLGTEEHLRKLPFIIENAVEKFNLKRAFKKAQEEIKSLKKSGLNAKNKLESVISSITDPICEIDKDYNILMANAAASKFFNTRDVIGKNFHKLFFNQQSNCGKCPVEETFKTRREQFGEFTMPDGRTIDIYTYPIFDKNGKIHSVVQYARDVTEKKKLQAQLIHSEKMASIGQLAGGIAHEFNNLLAMMSGRAQIAKVLGKPEEKEKLINVVLKATARAQEITRNLLSFARRTEPTQEMAYITDVIDRTLSLVSRDMKKLNIEIKRKYQRTPRIYLDVGQVQQVLFNIILNAKHAMLKGGTLTVKVDHDNQYVRTQISDTGGGISQEILEKIFDPFFTTKAPVGDGSIPGTGLGLSVSHGIITEHKGTLDVHSTPGKGTTVTIKLPIDESFRTKRQIALKKEKTRKLKKGTKGKKIKRVNILVVDDEKNICRILKDYLTMEGHKISVANDGISAIEKCKNDSYDIVFLDVIMPGIDGVQTFQRIQKISPKTKVIFLTGSATPDRAARAVKQGAYAWISKPFNIVKIGKLVRKIISQLDK